MTTAPHYHLVTNGTRALDQFAEEADARDSQTRAVASLQAEKGAQGLQVTVTPQGRAGGLRIEWADEYLSGWQVIEVTACTADHRGGSASPMTVRAEVWGLSADDRGIWLISGGDAWRSGPIDAESDPHYAAQEILSEHNALGDAKIVHSTSWRCEDTSIMLTYVAALDCPHVHDHWPASQLVSLMLPESVGEPLPHGADQPPTPRYVDVLLHAVRHLRFLLDYDATAAAAFSPAWRSHLMAFSPALAGMYAGEHEPEVMRQAG